jgi:hypothetical protein
MKVFVMVMCHNSEGEASVVAIVMIGEAFSNDFSFCSFASSHRLESVLLSFL